MKKFLAGLAVALTVANLWVWAADEITATFRLDVDNGAFKYTRLVTNYTVDQNNRGASMSVQNIATGAHEQIVIAADVATNGYSYFRNITTNADRSVDIGLDVGGTFYALMRLGAQDAALLRLHPTNAIYAQAIGGAVELENWINQD